MPPGGRGGPQEVEEALLVRFARARVGYKAPEEIVGSTRCR
ncbi:MAG: hypothetical protein ACREIR_17390 [Geminicoccaceae bacterium]